MCSTRKKKTYAAESHLTSFGHKFCRFKILIVRVILVPNVVHVSNGLSGFILVFLLVSFPCRNPPIRTGLFKKKGLHNLRGTDIFLFFSYLLFHAYEITEGF